MTEDRKPWEKMDGEPNRWFQRFEIFRLMGPGRTVEGLWKKVNPDSNTDASSTYSARCRQWQWWMRAEAWDAYLVEQAEATIRAKWEAEIMQNFEVLGRLSQMGRANIYDYLILSANGELIGLQHDALEKHGYLVKKISTLDGRISIELYDAQAALVQLGKALGIFREEIKLSGDVAVKGYVSVSPDDWDE